MNHVLFARQDNHGDVLLTGPAVRAIATRARVTYLCGPRGAQAARLLPCVERTIVHEAAWIDPEPHAVDADGLHAFVSDIAAQRFDEAIISTSFHQSPLPLALLLRLAGVARIGAISVDYPGALLDVRHRVDDAIHEVERNLSLAAAMGYSLPAGDDGALQVRVLPPQRIVEPKSYVAVHPGCTVPARAWSAEGNRALVEALTARGEGVVVTGARSEADLTAYVAGATGAVDLGGKTSFETYAALLRDARAVVCGNTAAAHLAAAVKTPVVSIFPPTVPASRFRPWRVEHELLGDQTIACAGCRARRCPIPGQPCLKYVRVDDVVAALERLRIEIPVSA